jgi:hypothetical protein
MSDAEPSSVPPVPISEHSRVLIAMHKAMRADSRRLITAVDALPAGDTQQAEALGRAFAAIVGLIHDHHWTEDDVMYPFLLQRVPTFESDALKLGRTTTSSWTRPWPGSTPASGCWRTSSARGCGRTPAAIFWRRRPPPFDRVLVDHLDREEAVVVPPFEALLSEADQHALQKEEAKLSTYRHMRLAMPWVLANATPEEEASLRATAPRLLGVIQDRVWEPRFARAMAPLYQSTQD